MWLATDSFAENQTAEPMCEGLGNAKAHWLFSLKSRLILITRQMGTASNLGVGPHARRPPIRIHA